ncbi:Calponin 1 [Intoshia linei]|uniref:Calponin 1 n=1 Tax=Intoshia linei TaxID=1819745 RepID=A0A177BAV8_9BILA|nr:Calponin 1 [Intoshia linei]
MAQEISNWIGQVIGENISSNLAESLHDGIVLCRLMEKIANKKIRYNAKSKMSFVMMENINAFTMECKSYGVDNTELFQTSDLFEKRNMKAVEKSLFALARIASNNPSYTGPKLGPKMSSENKRNFSEEQIKEERNRNISLQYGTNEIKIDNVVTDVFKNSSNKLTVSAKFIDESKLSPALEKNEKGLCSLCPTKLGMKINYTDVLALKQYINPDGTIIDRKYLDLCKQAYKHLTLSIRKSHLAGLLPNHHPTYADKIKDNSDEWHQYPIHFLQ